MPPVISTRPSARSVEVWLSRGVCIEPVGLNVPVDGSYSSAEARMPEPASPQPDPPVNRTRPSCSRVAAEPARATVMEPVGVNVPVVGSYSSAAVPQPPVKSTRPSREQRRRLAELSRHPRLGIAPVQAKPGARDGVGVGDGVGAGGPTAIAVAAVHGGGTMADPPSGCQTGPVSTSVRP